jgi:hypothetical protein
MTRELELLIERWEVLSDDPTVPRETRRILKICLDDVRLALADELMPDEHPLKEQHD